VGQDGAKVIMHCNMARKNSTGFRPDLATLRTTLVGMGAT
jgi:hypothetical protein